MPDGTGDVGQPRAEQKRRHAPACIGDRMKKMQENASALKGQLDEAMAKIAGFEAQFSSQKDATKQLLEVVEFLSNQSIQAPKEPTKTFEEMTALEQFKARPRVK